MPPDGHSVQEHVRGLVIHPLGRAPEVTLRNHSQKRLIWAQRYLWKGGKMHFRTQLTSISLICQILPLFPRHDSFIIKTWIMKTRIMKTFPLILNFWIKITRKCFKHLGSNCCYMGTSLRYIETFEMLQFLSSPTKVFDRSAKEQHGML